MVRKKVEDKPRKPDFHMWVVNKKTDEKGTVGAAWLNSDGSIRLKLNAFVTLTLSSDIEVKLYPAERATNANQVDPEQSTEV